MTREDDSLAKVLLSNKLLEREKLEEGKKLHETSGRLDLGDSLLAAGLIDKDKLALARRLAKMAKPGAKPTSSDAKPAAEAKEPKPDAKEMPTPGMPPRSPLALARLGDMTRFGRYEVVEKIAKGGMGVVLKARHPDLERLVAIKVLAAGEDADDEVLERFRREAKIAARLDHPGIVRVHDAGTEDGFPFIVMDLVDGTSLARVIKDEGVAPRKAALIAHAVARALAHAHEHSVVHRDIKPDNVLIEKATGEPKVTDFGIVKDLRGESEGRLTRTGFTLGSPCYMSPEQAAGRHDKVGPTSDVYSLGATLFEMLASRPPFEGESLHEIMKQVVENDPPSPRKLNPAVPLELEAICLKCLEKDPVRRYATARDLSLDLERFLDGKPVAARPVGPITRALRIARRHPAPVALGSVLILLLASIVGLRIAEDVSARRARRERIDTTLARARARLDIGRSTDKEQDARTAFFDAIGLADEVLRDEPKNDEARALKLESVLALGDRLIERRESGFAEFVFRMGEGLGIDKAEIERKIEAARLGSWDEAAHQAELKGDLDEALRLSREGLRALEEAGFKGEAVRAKIEALSKELAARKRGAEKKALVDLVEAKASSEPLAALEAARAALEIDPSDEALKARKLMIETSLRDRVSAELESAAAARRAASEAAGDGPAARAARERLTKLIERADERANAARTEREAGKLAEALGDARRAAADYSEALDAGLLARAKDEARAAADECEKGGAVRYAANEVAQAQSIEAEGDKLAASGDAAGARGAYQRAAQAYRLAAASGTDKGAASSARAEAERARSAAVVVLPPEHLPQSWKDAEATLKRAEELEARRDDARARDEYARATKLYTRAAEQGPPLKNAVALREKARSRQKEADGELASEFAPDDLDKAKAALASADEALARDDAATASSSYQLADYRFRQATEKSAPQAKWKRRLEVLRKQCDDARARAADAEKVGTALFESGKHAQLEGDEEMRQRHWPTAERLYRKALRAFEDAAATDK